MIHLLAAALLQAPPVSFPGPELPRVRPNVLLIVADDLGVDYLDWHPVGRAVGNPAPTPFLSSMASQALVFTDAYGAPSCSPSRGSLLTGRFPFRTGLGANIEAGGAGLALAEVTLPERLGWAGYTCGGFGKWHVSPDRKDPGLQGFRHFDGSIFNLGFGASNGYYDWTRVINGVGFTESGYATTVVTDSAIAWIQQKQAESAPWFAYVAYHAPHQPFEPPPPRLNRITRAKAGDPKQKIYRGMVEALDAELARLLAEVDTRDTLVIFVGDNGTSKFVAQPPILPAKSKSTAYQGGILVPAMVWGATVPRSGEQPGLFHLVDLYRTILDAAQVPRSAAKIDSVSLLDRRAPPALHWMPRRAELFAERFEPIGTLPFGPHTTLERAIRGSRYKLIRTVSGDELYDLSVDPWEGTDLLQGMLSGSQMKALQQLDGDLTSLLGS